MAKGKKRGLGIRDAVQNLVGRNVEANRRDPNQEDEEVVFVDDRTLCVGKKHIISNMKSHQVELQSNVQIQQQANTSRSNMQIQQQANTSRSNMQIQQQAPTSRSDVQTHQQQSKQSRNGLQVQHQIQIANAQIVNRAQTQAASRSREDRFLHAQSEEVESDEQNSSGSQEDDSATTNKKGRGPAQFPDQWDKEMSLDVTLNARGQIVGSQYQELATAIGCFAKVGTNFPITKTWNQIDDRNKESAWKEVKRNTFLPQEAKTIVYEMLNSTWKEWKYRIKNHFKKFEPNDDNDKEMIKQLDNRVVESQFREAIHHWRKPEVQEQASTNATNRGQRKFPHRTGRTSFSEVANEFSLNGVPATQLDVWILSRSLRKGFKDDGETSDLHDFLLGTLSSMPFEERTSEYKGKLYQDVVQNGKRGRVTCVGKSIHKKTCGTSSSRIRQSIQEREELREELYKLKEEREELQQIKEDVKQEREQLSSKLEQLNELKAMYGVQPSPRIASCSTNNVSQVPDASSTGREVRHVLSPISSTHALYKDGVKVSLFGDGIPKKVVAEGILVSKDPKEKISNLPLGPDHWKIYVENVICPTYILSGSGENAYTIAQAINNFLAKANVLQM